MDRETKDGLDGNVPHSEVTYKVIGVAMAIHNELGPGHREEVYQQAMARKLPDAGVAVEEQVPVEISLEGGNLLTYYLDLLVDQQVIVELKAASHPLTNDDVAQVIDYPAATGLPVALLMSFGRTRLEFRRILPPRYVADRRRRQWTKPLACREGQTSGRGCNRRAGDKASHRTHTL